MEWGLGIFLAIQIMSNNYPKHLKQGYLSIWLFPQNILFLSNDLLRKNNHQHNKTFVIHRLETFIVAPNGGQCVSDFFFNLVFLYKSNIKYFKLNSVISIRIALGKLASYLVILLLYLELNVS